jgi:hypothetical protein
VNAVVVALLSLNLVAGTWRRSRKWMQGERGIDENSMAWR